MATFRYRQRGSAASEVAFVAAGALAGMAAGVFLAQRFGGLSGITTRLRDRFGRGDDEGEPRWSGEDYIGQDDELDDSDEALEERVLEAYRNDPILSERAIDIGAIGDGIIELTGWVHAENEATHAVTLARGVPGVETVVNRLTVREDEQELDEASRRYRDGDPALTEARWEGQGVGTGRRRQGTSAEADRHADPRPELEERWLRENHALEAAAEETQNIAERRKRKKGEPKGDRTEGGPVSPSGVPKSDHVADPESARDVMRDETGRDTLRAD
jgi:BON domain